MTLRPLTEAARLITNNPAARMRYRHLSLWIIRSNTAFYSDQVIEKRGCCSRFSSRSKSCAAPPSPRAVVCNMNL